jgi:hypothetical protein
MTLGSLDDNDRPPIPAGGQIHTHTSFRDYIVRAGLNYQFH